MPPKILFVINNHIGKIELKLLITFDIGQVDPAA